MTYLLDSCILIDYLNGIEQAVEWCSPAKGMAISLVSWMEVMAGARSADAEDVTRNFLKRFKTMAIDCEMAEIAVKLRRDSKRLKMPDAVIMATALLHGLTLVTRNSKDFQGDSVLVPYILLQ